MPKDTKHRLRCHCGHGTTLAFYGHDRDGEPYVHLKVYKQRRVFGNAVFRGGTVELMCSFCDRSTRIHMGRDKWNITPGKLPPDECLPK